MKEYTCTICGEKSYSAVELEHMNEPFCVVCGGEIKESEEHMTNEIALAQRALELAMLISTETTTDAWFEYSGHIKSVTAYYAPDGWKGELTTAVMCETTTTENMQRLIGYLEFIYAIAERKNV